jgi:hypothetical protein
MFKLVKNPYQGDVIEELPISGITVAVGDMLMLAKGATTWVLATSALECWQKKAVAQEAASVSATTVKAVIVQPEQIWEATSTNDANAAHNGDRMTLTNASTVNNTGTDVDTVVVSFIQRGYAGETTDRRLLGNIIYGSGATQIN